MFSNVLVEKKDVNIEHCPINTLITLSNDLFLFLVHVYPWEQSTSALASIMIGKVFQVKDRKTRRYKN